MTKRSRAFQRLQATLILAAGTACAAEQSSATEKAPLRATLIESKEKNRGVTIHASGASIAMLVTALDDRYVTSRSQQATRIVVRLDRIDGIWAAF